MKKLILVFVLAASPVAASEPVTVTIETIRNQQSGWVRVVTKLQNNTDKDFRTVFFRCTAFLGVRAIASQLGTKINLRGNRTGYTETPVSVPARPDSMSCVFESTAD
jgi:hypothetical protein